MKLYLIRHGKTEANLRHLYLGRTEVPLLESEIPILRRNADLYPRAEVYVTSGMLRTEQTFAAIYGDIPHSADPDLRELDFGRFEMHSYEELKEDPDYQAWISGDNLANAAPGGESFRMQQERVLRALERIIAGGKDAVCLVHGGTISAAMSAWFPPEDQNIYSLTPEPKCGFAVEIAEGLPVSYAKIEPPEDSFRYFENRACKYYPCHDAAHINCLFCYCPLYELEHCPGDHYYKEKNGRPLKVCTNCTFPHKAENYDIVMKFLKARMNGGAV